MLGEAASADKTFPLYRAAKNSSIVAGNGTFFSDSPDDVSPADAIEGTYLDYRQEKGKPEAVKGSMSCVSKRPPPTEAPNADIAPWMDDGLPALSTHGLTSSNFFNDGLSKAQPSPSFRPGSGRTADSESPDPMFLSNDRRPSLASATTIDSQSSLSKASTSKGTPYKKVAGFFGDEHRQSPRSSETSISGTPQREQTASSRHGSRHTSRDEGRPISPSSSRPRTPLPSSDVIPWLFQDFKVSLGIFVRTKQPVYTCIFSGDYPGLLISVVHKLYAFSTYCNGTYLNYDAQDPAAANLLFTVYVEVLLFPTKGGYVNSRGVGQSHNRRDTPCYGSRDRPLI